ncbi:ketoacyl-ACP synthase III [Paenibacillus sp. J5C_2022]|uniref:ketoacyl-ACP synthase III n=1 Tax=Paenibacillus sp. J5C2022 TaxID=2977129 RepID=UPI0021D3DB84|nr:ketoacyl-ACP synthase III [Paenibacillus sp. J5C2022]MCU6710418.1 ketoacyl-ACP synthase III [Paenibacillus sp. J5C2022]
MTAPAHRVKSQAAITAIGSYVPSRILTNEDLEKMVDTSHEWIVQRTGIHERRIAAENEYTSDLIFRAIDNMTSRYGTQLHDADYVIVATSTPDTVFPSMAARVCGYIGAKACGSVDLQAACAGFTAGLQLANALLLTGIHRKVLVVGADALSRITDYTDRTTCILFGDGAGAVLLEHSGNEDGDIWSSYSSTDGSGGHHVYLSNGAAYIGEHEIIPNGKLVQNGREVYRWAVSHVSEGIKTLLEESGLSPGEISWFAPHNANARIIEALAERVGFTEEQALSSIARYGNTSAASIPLAVDDAVRSGKLKKGDIVLMHGFGGGLTQAGVIVRWSL